MKTSPRTLVIVDGVRTPFARMGSTLAYAPADELGRIATQALLSKTGIEPGLIDEVIFGCVGQPVESANVARIIALRAGVPESVPAITVSRNCASGCEAVTQAWEKLQAGRGEIFLVGGVESMSNYPLLFHRRAADKFAALGKARRFPEKLKALAAFRFRDFKPVIGLQLGLSDPFCGLSMGQTAECISREAGITRAAMDAFAAASHLKAQAARERLAEEITPVYLPPYDHPFEEDNGPRDDSTPERLAKLRPVFEKLGMVTAGNSSQLTDGAVALLVMSEEKAAALGYTQILGTLGPFAYAACDPSRMGLGPVYAMDKLEKLSTRKTEEADIVEINEAFAGQVLACQARMDDEAFCQNMLGREHILGRIPDDRLNVNGGAIALGHPVGATGARLILTALHELRRRKKSRALVSLCVGGGQGVACWLDREGRGA